MRFDPYSLQAELYETETIQSLFAKKKSDPENAHIYQEVIDVIVEEDYGETYNDL